MQTNETRDQRYRELDEATQALYATSEKWNAVRQKFDSFGFPGEEYGTFVDIFGDVILGLEPVEGVPTQLVAQLGFPLPMAQKIASDIGALLYPEKMNSVTTTSTPAPVRMASIPENIPTTPTPIPETSLQKALHDLPNYSQSVQQSAAPTPTTPPSVPPSTHEEPPRRVTYNAMLDVPTPGGEAKTTPEQWGKKF